MGETKVCEHGSLQRQCLLCEQGAEIARLREELEALHTWDGIMRVVHELYPPDVVTGESGDPGPTIVVLMRETDTLRARVAALEKLLRPVVDLGHVERAKQAKRGGEERIPCFYAVEWIEQVSAALAAGGEGA